MKRTPVSSTSIASIGYDAMKASMEIEFQSGTLYEYFDVPKAIYETLLLDLRAGRLERGIVGEVGLHDDHASAVLSGIVLQVRLDEGNVDRDALTYPIGFVSGPDAERHVRLTQHSLVSEGKGFRVER